MKKIIFFLITFLSFSISVFAQPIDDDCVNDGTCLTLCNYKTTIKMTGSYISGSQPREVARNITLYYHYSSQEFSLKWQSKNADASIYKKGPLALSTLFSNKGNNVYWSASKDLSLENFTCPQYGYLDTSDLNSDNELCFDDDGKSCTNQYSNIGTAFGKHGGFQSVEKDYNFEEQIENYKNWIIQDIAEDITNGKISTSEIPNKVKKDFQTNFLNGNQIPSFIANSEVFQSLNQATSDEYEKYKEQELKKLDEELKSGKITEEEHQEKTNNWSASGEEVATDVEEMLQNIVYGNGGIIKDWDASTCDSILGKENDPNAPIYYLNFAFDLIKYAAIILFFVLTIIEYFKAITSNDNDALKKATQKTIKRLILCVIIFFLPILINFLFKILGIIDDPTCGIGG